jgi:hypothetical protein
MHTCAIINSNAKRSNVACCTTKTDDTQEIPTPQGFLVFQIRARFACLMRNAAPATEKSTRTNVAFQSIKQAVKKICAASFQDGLARSNPT